MANRKQRRKMKQKSTEYEYTTSIKNTLIVLGVVVLIFLLFYFITVAINEKTRKLNTKEEEKIPAEIQYYEILGDDTFKMTPEEYYVLFYDFDSPNSVYYDYLFDQYAAVEGQYIYKVNLGNGFNKKFIATEDTNKKAKKAGDLKVKEATLIKIVKGKNKKYIEGSTQEISTEVN